MTALLDDPTSGVVLAGDGPQLTGFGYGFTLAPHTTRWTAMSPPLPSPQSEERPGRGWRPLGTLTGGPTAAAPVFDAYLRDTLADLRSALPGE